MYRALSTGPVGSQPLAMLAVIIIVTIIGSIFCGVLRTPECHGDVYTFLIVVRRENVRSTLNKAFCTACVANHRPGRRAHLQNLLAPPNQSVTAADRSPVSPSRPWPPHSALCSMVLPILDSSCKQNLAVFVLRRLAYLLSTVSSTFIHVVTSGKISFCLRLNDTSLCVACLFFFHSCIAIVNDSSVIKGVQISLQDSDFHSFRDRHRSRIAESYGKSTFNFFQCLP